jgi:phage shock protein PspC (stress-responsive transcriptional regulator)
MSEQQGAAHTRIRRDTDNGMVGGVAAGFARNLDVDVVWIRLAFVLATVFAGGLGLVVYLASWLIIPAADGSERRLAGAAAGGDSARRGGAFWTGAVLVALGGVILLDRLLAPLIARLGWTSPRELALPLVLIGVGALVYRSSRNQGRSAGSAEDAEGTESLGERIEHRVERWSDEFERVTEDWEQRLEEHGAAQQAAGAVARVTPITLGTALITLGVLWLARTLGVTGVTLTRTLAATLLVIGAGLVVSAFVGRGRGLMPLGVLLSIAVMGAVLGSQFPDRLGMMSIGDDGVLVTEDAELTLSPTTLAELPANYDLTVGRVLIDLSALTDEVADAGTVRLEIDMGIGDLRVILPEGVAVDVQVEVGIGRIALLGSTAGGLGVSDRQRLAATDGSGGMLVIEISHGIGNVTVTR